MCSALILVNVLIFALPMSTTQVVISGLTGVSIIFFHSVGAETEWFIFELCLWIIAPILGMLLASCTKTLMEKHILSHSECRKRILIITPLYMTFAFTLMFGVPLTKNFLYTVSNKRDNRYTILFIVLMVSFPITALVSFRLLLLRRARNVEIVKLKRKNAE